MSTSRTANISPSNTSKFWMDLLNSTQLISKNISYFPQVKACRLRIAYTKLESASPNNCQLILTNAQKTKGSFLLNKQSSTIQPSNQYQKLDKKRRTILNKNSTTRYGNNSSFIFDGSTELIRTIDVAEIKKIKSLQRGQKKGEGADLSRSGSNKKSQEFTQYFKQVILSQKMNNDLNKMFSQGKCLDISDRTHFEKLERMKLSIMNRKIEQKQKSFHCVSTRLNKYQLQKKQVELPSLKKKKMKKQKNQKSQELQKNEKKPISSFACEPWQIDSHENDIQQN